MRLAPDVRPPVLSAADESRAGPRGSAFDAPATGAAWGPAEEEAERLAGEMADAWSVGGRPGAEEYLARLPDAGGSARAAARLIYEEVCLREALGDVQALSDVRGRFPEWAGELSLLMDCHALFKEGTEGPCFPEPGDRLGGFQLLAELGLGVLGRVFLATQPDLGDRPVVLKVTPRSGDEHLSLARLQHTNIVPLYSAHDFPDDGLRALCMPYLGGVTLARVLGELSGTPPERRTGAGMLAVVERADGESPVATTSAGASRRFLARCSFAQAVCWVGACLADALQYAHDRGLVHLDLKPANVLLSGDLRPMLLDFHVARGPLAPGRRAPERLGGTPGYMSPEQGAAIAAVEAGGYVPAEVDGRSDVYSLGVLLFQALGGTVPTDFGASAALLPGSNRQVSVGLGDVLARCLDRDPRRRYPDAASLAEDLRRHLADRPLAGVPNRSPAERWGKWRRRNPLAPAVVGLLATALLASALAGVCVLGNVEHRRERARSALVEGRRLLDRRQYDGAVRALSRGAEAIRGRPGDAELAGRLNDRLGLARRVATAAALHLAADRLRYLAGAEPPTGSEVEALESRCLAIWDARRQILDPAGPALAAEDERHIREDLDDLSSLSARVRARRGARSGTPDARGSAPPAAPVGGPGAAADEYCRRGRALLRDGETSRAAGWFARALAERPDGFWPNFYQGVCDYRAGRLTEAVSAFRVCIALDPRSAPSYANRGLALAALGRLEEALRDSGRALEIEPWCVPVSMNRALILARLGRHREALDALNASRAWGADPARLASYAELVRRARDGLPGATRKLHAAMRYGTPGRPGTPGLDGTEEAAR